MGFYCNAAMTGGVRGFPSGPLRPLPLPSPPWPHPPGTPHRQTQPRCRRPRPRRSSFAPTATSSSTPTPAPPPSASAPPATPSPRRSRRWSSSPRGSRASPSGGERRVAGRGEKPKRRLGDGGAGDGWRGGVARGGLLRGNERHSEKMRRSSSTQDGPAALTEERRKPSTKRTQRTGLRRPRGSRPRARNATRAFAPPARANSTRSHSSCDRAWLLSRGPGVSLEKEQ